MEMIRSYYLLDYVVHIVPLVNYIWQIYDILFLISQFQKSSIINTEEEGAEQNCEGCITHGLSICPDSVEGLVLLASCRMSQCRFDEAEEILMKVNSIIAGIGKLYWIDS